MALGCSGRILGCGECGLSVAQPMTLNDLVLTECYLQAKKALEQMHLDMRAGDLKAVEKAWERISYARLQAGYRYNDLKFGKPVIG